MDKENKYYNLIESMIRNHRKFDGLEPVIEEIIDKVYEQAKDNLDIIQDQNLLEGYLNRIISTEIIRTPKELNFKPQKQPETEVRFETEDKEITIGVLGEADEASDLNLSKQEQDYDEAFEQSEQFDISTSQTEINSFNDSDIEVNQELVDKMINGNSYNERLNTEIPTQENEEDILSDEFVEESEYIQNDAEASVNDSDLYSIAEEAGDNIDLQEESQNFEETEQINSDSEPVEKLPLVYEDDDSQISLEETLGNEGIFETEQDNTYTDIDVLNDSSLDEGLSTDGNDSDNNLIEEALVSEEEPYLNIIDNEENLYKENSPAEITYNSENSENYEDEVSDEYTVNIEDSVPQGNVSYETNSYTQEGNISLSAFEDITAEELENIKYDNGVVEIPNDLSPKPAQEDEYMLDINIPEEVVDLDPSDENNSAVSDEGNDYIPNLLDEDYTPNAGDIDTENNTQNNENTINTHGINSQYTADIDADTIIRNLTELSETNPDLNILNVCELKYKKGYTIEQISETLNLTPDIVIKALSEIISII